MQVIRAAGYRRMPWKNGGGETIEIAVAPAGATLAAFDWRVSMARVDSDGPFSLFPGIDRTLAILEGDGLRLAIDGRTPVTLTPDSEPCSFPGDVAVTAARIGRAVTDLNVMTRRGQFQHRLRRVRIDGSLELAISAPTALLLCHAGGLRIEARPDAIQLQSLETLRVDERCGSLRIASAGPAVVFLIEISALHTGKSPRARPVDRQSDAAACACSVKVAQLSRRHAMRRPVALITTVLVTALALAGTNVRAGASIPKVIAAAVADPARPEADRARDADRKPAECVAFAGLKRGEHVVDLIPGGGYFTRIFSAVVGPKGHVFAVAPPRRAQAPADAPDPAAPVQAIAADPHYNNVSVSVERVTQLTLPEKVDLIWTSQNYHDIHNVPDVDVGAFNKAVFAALRPGGIFIVLDHAAEAGSGFRDTSTLHRIDAEAVKNEVLAAGFVFAGESDVVRNPADTHKLKIFDPALHDKTDRFILKFRKPK